MASFLFPLRQATLPIRGVDKVFPIHRIYCVGRNYREHALEMGHNPDREAPFFFQKPATAAVTSDEHRVPYPPQTTNLHHEAELVVAIHKSGRDLKSVEEAQQLIYGYALGCDLTRRDLQQEAKKLSRPWDAAKGFDSSAPMTTIVPKQEFAHDIVDQEEILQLWVNEELQQSAPLSTMIWSVPETIQHLSNFFTLQPGDLIMTGTPAGVGKLEIGDNVRIACGDTLPECSFTMVASDTTAA